MSATQYDEEQLYEIMENTNEPPKPTDEDTELFKQQVGEWLKLDDQVRKLSCAIRERRTHQRALSDKIQAFMIKFGFDNLNTAQGIIKSNVRVVKQPIKIVDIKMKIEDLMLKAQNEPNTPVTYKELFDSIFTAERPTVTKQSLHRRIPKVSLSLDI
jgi:seryl-tRNA synthetase